ncbi:hypothetical protein EW145_g6097 [Phellinidium pouzarii]|uniref:Cytochrome P450 n=1 Tax=Phellinidium pouzarii TaxID=167371 RepID=A0A4S4KYX5_9AGAM|nr:hypothetical protein EW145_g6097 [Phellinidium pouzarii]
MPTSFEWLKAAEWKKIYGDIVFVESLGKPMVFLGSYEGAVELLEKRSSIYSSRPRSIMMSKAGIGSLRTCHTATDGEDTDPIYGNTSSQQQSQTTSTCKLAKHTTCSADSFGRQRTSYSIFASTCVLMQNLNRLADAFGLCYDLSSSIGATIMMMAYGHEVEPENDPYISLAEKGAYAVGVAAAPGAFLVELIPWLRHVPAWIPGAGFQNVAKEAHALSHDMRYKPYYETKAKVLEGTARPSMTNSLIEANMDETGNIRDEETIANTAGVAYIGGSDTRRAQEELDRVVGRDRLPSIEDKATLPYVNALCNECLRWQPVTPLGGPRMLMEDDVYNGYFLPKGAMIIYNVWLFLHDPEEYPDPDTFRPERFLVGQGQCAEGETRPTKVPRDPSKVTFGFGRRICPGRHMAMNTIFLTVSSVLSAFDIQKAIGQDGRPITPTGAYVSSLIRLLDVASELQGIFESVSCTPRRVANSPLFHKKKNSHPEPFECRITPRSERSRALNEMKTFDF